MNTTVPYQTEKKVIVNTSWKNISTDNYYWASNDSYLAVFDFAKKEFEPHRGKAVNCVDKWRRENCLRFEEEWYSMPIEKVRSHNLPCCNTEREGSTPEDLKRFFEIHVAKLIKFFTYEDLYTDGFIHAFKILPEYDYHGTDVTITFTIIEKVYDRTYRGRITDKAEALQFLEEHGSERYYYDGIRGYYSTCAYLPIYVKPEQMVNPDWSDGESDYFFESPLVAVMDISVLADDEIRNILIAKNEWPRDDIDYKSPMSFEKYAERRKLMDAGELRFDGAYISEDNESGTNWNDLIRERENQ